MTSTDRNDGFWARVRTLLRPGAEPSPQAASEQRKARAPRQVEETLRRGWIEAGQRRVSLCVVALEMDGYPEYFAAYGKDAVEQSLRTLEATIAGVLPRPTDRCLRAGVAGFVLVLPDMPGLMARELTSRIAVAVRRAGLPHRESHAGHITLSMGLAVVNPSEQFDRSVLSTASQAVKKAQRRGIGRLEIVDLRIDAEKRRKAA